MAKSQKISIVKQNLKNDLSAVKSLVEMISKCYVVKTENNC